MGSDSARFRGFPVFAGEGMQFESHLEHVFSLFRGLWSAECVQIQMSLWAPAGAHFCWWRLVWRLLLLAWTAVLLVLLHGRERLELHDLLRLGIIRACFLAVCVGRGRPCTCSSPGVVVMNRAAGGFWEIFWSSIRSFSWPGKVGGRLSGKGCVDIVHADVT
jgi:hypothetical protein